MISGGSLGLCWLLGAADPAALAAVQALPPIITVDGVKDKGDIVSPEKSASPIGAEPVSDEIIVTAESYGKARVAAESEFDETAISAHGADSIQQLLQKLTPWIDPSGDEPIVLINGEPAGFDRSILGYPSEALSRLEVLKPEAASEYGQPAGKRVVNLVLKRKFSSLNADLGADWATAGGQSGQRASVARTAINERLRWNVQARVSRDSPLWKYKRNTRRRDGLFDGRGLLVGVDGGELDPFLSDLVGAQVDFTGLPLDRSAAVWDLDDFADLAGQSDPVDPARYETLMPRRRSASLSLGLTRPVGAWNISLNLQASQSDNQSYRGPAMAQILWRRDHPASPFSGDVLVVRPIGSIRALAARGKSRSLGASVSANGRILGWQNNFGVNFNRSWNESALENGVETAALQAAIDEGGALPLAELGPEWLAISRNEGRTDNLSAQWNAQKPVITLPAGDVSLSLGANGSVGRSARTQWNGYGAPQADRSNRGQWQSQISLNVPINRDRAGLLPLPVNLSFDLSASASQSSGGRTQKRWSLGANLEPWTWLQLRGSMDRMEMAPGFDQLDGARDEQVSRVFDYARQEMAEVIWIRGGNPALRRGRQQSLSLSAMLRPLGPSGLSLNVAYRRSESMNGISALPELTPAVEAAFPERIERDAEGRLVRIDARSINLLSDSNSNISSGLTLRWPMETSPTGGEAAWQFQASVNHRMQLSAERRIRAGLPVIDLLGGDSGQSRHNLSGQITASRMGLGMTLSANWASAGRLRGEGGDKGGLRFKPPLTTNLSLYLEPDRLWPGLKKRGLWKGLRISLDVQNLTNQYRRVLRDDGTTPPGFGRDDVDPLGRTMRIQLRKKF